MPLANVGCGSSARRVACAHSYSSTGYPDRATVIPESNGASLQSAHRNPRTDDGVERVLTGLDFQGACPWLRGLQYRRHALDFAFEERYDPGPFPKQ